MMHYEKFRFIERPETVAFVWPSDRPTVDVINRHPYSVTVSDDRAPFQAVQASIGWQVTDKQWRLLQKELISGSMAVVWCDGEPIGAACALARGDGWAELAWVAVAPPHRGNGVGKIGCSAVVNQLLLSGLTQIFGSTQDERLAALSIYLDLGFHPVYRHEKVERWESIYQNLGKPFTPALWGWPSIRG